MLAARPLGIFSRDFVIEADGQQVALLDVSRWKEAGEITIGSKPFKLYREGFVREAFVLEEVGQPVARAIKFSAFRSRFDLELEAGHYSLQRDSAFARSFSVVQNGEVVGRVRRSGLFTRNAVIDLPSAWSAPIQVFVFWLVLVIWNREDSSAAVFVAST
jgi:hypothetical protein